MRAGTTAGFTLVELLVVIAILGMLTALMLPAVNAAREAGRRTVCQSKLRQIALAALNHESAQGFYPSGGWSGGYVGVPGRGFGRRQSGGWCFSLLGYLERNDLAELGRDDPPAEREAKVARLLQTPIAVFNCPTRRPAVAYPIFYAYARQPLGSAPVSAVARSDYAMNCGDQRRCDLDWIGPLTLEEGDDATFPWPDVSDHTGVSYMRSQITPAHVRDGASHTYFIAEKQVASAHYTDGVDMSDDWSMYTGYQDDIHRSTFLPPGRDGDATRSCRFGSLHPNVWHVAFCDASIRGLSYDIDRHVHRALGNRSDGRVLSDDLIQ